MTGNTVTIVKLGKIVNVTEESLRNGDMVLLQAGDLIPADLKLIEARSLEVDDFDLTGEIIPVTKKIDEEDVFVYKGSRVTRGNGKGIVVATEEETEYGEILKQRWGQVKYRFPSLIKAKYFVLPVLLLPPLLFSSALLGNLALVFAITFATVIFVVLMQNDGLFQYVLTMEEIKKIRRQNIQMIDETSLNGIDKLDVVCFDKTGVLTTRNIEVKAVHLADETLAMDSFLSESNVFGLIKIACALCNDVVFFEKINQADPIDKALIAFALKNGLDVNEIASKYKRIFEKPFDSEARYMVSGFEVDGKKIFFAKGDPEVILRMCRTFVTASGVEKSLHFDFLSSINTRINSVNQNGDRPIAIAYSLSDSEPTTFQYTFLCLLQLENPVKPGASEVVNELRETGVRTLILTGDGPEAAMKVGEEIGIDESEYCLTGKNIAQMDLAEIAKQSNHVSVFARLLPSQKSILIMALQQRNNFVVMVGDGANDTIALKVADVGISFKENSSPFAKRVSKILINDLTDLLTIIRGARRIKWRVKYSMLFRALILTSMFLIFYLRMLT